MMKILFIENHAIFAQQVINCFLSEHKVTVIPSIVAARQDLVTNQYDVLLVDYDLDDGKGDELIRELRKQNSKLRIVGVSAHNPGNEALLKAGANAVCSKLNFDHIQEVL
jgi:CheY-like chemotaxis protein